MQQMKREALLCWMSKVLHIQDLKSTQQIRDGQLIIKLLNKIPGINLDFKTLNLQGQSQEWKNSYFKLKAIMQQLNQYMKNILKYKFVNALSVINLLEMAKGQDDQGLIVMITLIFLICFNLGPQNSQFFVEKAIMLSQIHQQQLMDIVKNNQIPKYQSNQMQQYQQKYQKQREKVKEMISVLQSITMENQSLKQALISDSEQIKRLKDILKKTQQQKQKIKKQLFENYRTKQEDQPSKSLINQHQEQIIQQLKANLIQQEKSHGKQMYQLRQKIQNIQQELEMYKNRASQFQENTFRQNVDHSNCINRQIYAKQMSQLGKKITQASSKQWKMKLQNIRLNNLNEELKQKNKKFIQQNKNKENQSSKEQKDLLKLDILKRIKDGLKIKMEKSLFDKQLKRGINKNNQNGLNLQSMILNEPDILQN